MQSNHEHHRGHGLRPYTKSWLSPEDQASLLASRGLCIEDAEVAVALLEHLSYYRLSGYCVAFEYQRHRFVPEATLSHVDSAHTFDVSLRELFDRALEIVEIDLRARVASHFGRKYQAFGHCTPSSFHTPANRRGVSWHSQWLERVQKEASRSKEVFVVHFARTYREFPDLPIWMLTEVMSFGLLSRMFAGMHRQDQRAIARCYGLQPRFLQTWLHHFVYVRNICAHHGRLWDRVWSVKAQLPPHSAWQAPRIVANQKPYTTLLMLAHMVTRVNVRRGSVDAWRRDVSELLHELPVAPAAAERLGLPPGWTSSEVWNL